MPTVAMDPDRLNLLFLAHLPPSPPTFGAQRRMEGLWSAMARRHHVAGVSLISSEFDRAAAANAMRAYCEEVALVPAKVERGLPKRLLQLRALASSRSFERHHLANSDLLREVEALLLRRRYHVVSVEFPYLWSQAYRLSPPGEPAPRLLLDEHNIEHDLARQSRDASEDWLRRLHHEVNWKKVRREELQAWRQADGVVFVSEADKVRAQALCPEVNPAVVPNAVDVDYFRPDRKLPPSDGTTLVFFGTLDYFPNRDGMRHFLRDIWPRIEKSHPLARVKVVGPHPTPEVLARQGPRFHVAGLVEDLRPHLAEAAVIVVPLRVGGGTRFKVLEAMAMGKAVVSTRLGAEGIAAVHERDILLADDPAAFAASVGRLLDDPELRLRLGRAARELVESKYSWAAAASRLELFLRDVLASPGREEAGGSGR